MEVERGDLIRLHRSQELYVRKRDFHQPTGRRRVRERDRVVARAQAFNSAFASTRQVVPTPYEPLWWNTNVPWRSKYTRVLQIFRLVPARPALDGTCRSER